ncbi:uncharacterized protein E0L32_000815 [Thyridium curvatum]|uniref:SMP-30/Gluconolactonase/LRE-like region domain-containing protein n=1 Tax=Thyridium curvatum TaxID=1093900 RepID=A0A507B7A1_9PEZI|nr:uncharacterized protein E0L32_000815 [Thyridium curvatum]TPX12638.1 hypothetical protein E0L32_000815 [Thyridium curvatum]
MVRLQLVILATIGAVRAAPTTAEPSTPAGLPLPVSTVYSFPKGSFVENLAVRSNGEILVTRTTSAELVLLDPQRPGCAVPVYNFTKAGLSGMTGITEYAPDVFAVLAGDYHFGKSVGVGSWTLFSLDMRGVKLSQAACGLAGGNLPRVRKVALVKESQLLNGLAAHGKYVLASDTFAGLIYRVDMSTGDYSVAINATYLSKLKTPHGVNGIRIVGDTLYAANSGQSILVKVPITENGAEAGPYTVIAHNKGPVDHWDDFAVDSEGGIWAVTASGNTLVRITPDGNTQTVVAGNLNSTAIAEGSSAQFGRGSCDSNVLYVTTVGGLLGPINGTVVIPGALVSVDTEKRGAVGIY